MKINKKLFSLCLIFSLFGCKSDLSKPTYKYTIWVGNEVVSTGNNTNTYNIDKDFIYFLSSSGTRVTVPLSRLISIEDREPVATHQNN